MRSDARQSGRQTNTEGDTVSLQLSATDANNSTLTYQASALPPGLSINSSTGLISGTVSSGDAANAPYTVTVTATDTQGYSSGQQFVWMVNPANLNPVMTNPGSQINTQGDVLSLQMQATDPVGNGLTYSATGLPPGLTIDPSSGLISGVLSNSSASGSPYSVTVTATDGNYSGNTTFTWSVTNQAVTVTNPGTQSGTGGQPASLQISASDPHGYTLTYAAVGLPPGLSINASTGLISGTLASTAGGAYQATVMAGDNYGNSGSAAFTWNVAYVNQAPTLDNPGDQLNKPGDLVSLQLSGDDVDGDTVTYSATGLPSGLTLNQTTGIISGTLPASAASSMPYSVTVTASDGTLTANQTFNWYVTTNVVTLTNPGDQTNTEGDSVSLQLSASDSNKSTLSYQASGLPAGLSINSSTGLISGKVASGDSANGPYTVTVTADDAQGYSSYQQFNWTINAPTNALTLTDPGNQSNAEGDDVSLQLQASDPDGDTLEYTASGLPIGLGIDPTTGLISGTVDYSAAEISNGQYNVTVTVNDGNGQTASQSFVWTIADTPQPPWLEYPEFQDSETDTSASLQLVAGSPDDKTLTYSATGLPAGLSVNPNTGLISGTITASPGSYTVTATVKDTSNQSDSQTFTWQVTSGSAPRVLLSFDGEPVGDDYLAGVDPATPIPVLVTLEGASPGLHTIQISIPSGKSAVSQSSFQLADGGSESIELTPEEESQAFDDVLLVAYVDGNEAGDAKGTNPDVTIAGVQSGGHIRNWDTPTGMKDRIPPINSQGKALSRLTAVEFTITPTLQDDEVVVFQVLGNSVTNGTASIVDDKNNLPSSVWLQKSGDLYVIGGTQTAPSNAGKLSIVAYGATKKGDTVPQDQIDTTKELANSAGFSVAAIPIAVKMSDPEPVAGYDMFNWKGKNSYEIVIGAVYTKNYVSDSGNINDLSEVKISEKLQVNLGNTAGSWKTWLKGLEPSGFLPATGENEADAHGPKVPVTKVYNGRPVTPTGAVLAARNKVKADINGNKDGQGPGQADLLQYFVFTDNRTGATDKSKPLIVTQSGFSVHLVAQKERGIYAILVTKKPGKNNGAGAGQMAAKDTAEQAAKFNERLQDVK